MTYPLPGVFINGSTGVGGSLSVSAQNLNDYTVAITGLDLRTSALESLVEFRPETYAAIPSVCGNGTTDDTNAFAAMGNAITALGINGSAVVSLRPGAIYRVGRQTLAGNTTSNGSWLPTPVFVVDGIKRLVIAGNGAVIKHNDGLHAGSFDPITGAIGPNVGVPDATTFQYNAGPGDILNIYSCTTVVVRDLEIDGNDIAAIKGGTYGGNYSVAATGLSVRNTVSCLVENVLIHHMILDGMYFDHNALTINSDGGSCQLISSSFTYCGRNNISMAGAANFHASSCSFSHAGRSQYQTAPQVGIDFEVYTPILSHNGVLESCEFTDNASRAYGASDGWRNLLFKRCIFRGAHGLSGFFASSTSSNVTHEDCYIGCLLGTVISSGDTYDVDTGLKPFTGVQFRRCIVEDADYIQPVTFYDTFGLPSINIEARQVYGDNTNITSVTIINGPATVGGVTTSSGRWRLQVFYDTGSGPVLVEDYNNINTTQAAIGATINSVFVTVSDTGTNVTPAGKPVNVTAFVLPVSPLNRASGGLVLATPQNCLIEDCTLIAHNVAPFYTANAALPTNPMIVRRTTALVYRSSVADMASQATVRAMILDGVTFREPPAPVNEVQSITITNSPASGTWTLSMLGLLAGTFAITATAATIQTALAALSNIGTGNVTVTGAAGGPWTVTFVGGLLSGQAIPNMTTTNTFPVTTPTAAAIVAQVTNGRKGLIPPTTGWYVNIDSTVLLGPGGVTVGPSIHWSAYNGRTGIIRNPQTPQMWGPWIPGAAYSQSDLVTFGGQLYSANTNFTEAGTFTSGAWTAQTSASAGQLTPTPVKTTSYTAVPGDLVRADVSAGTFTVTLPLGAAGETVAIKKMDTTATIITVAVTGGDTIDGATTMTLRLPSETRTFTGQSGGWVVSSGLNTLSSLDTRYLQVPATTQAAGYTLALTDAATAVEATSATAMNITVPPNSSAAFPVGAVVELVQVGAGQITVAAGAGVTLRTASSLTSRAQYSVLALRQRAANEWVVSGDLT